MGTHKEKLGDKVHHASPTDGYVLCDNFTASAICARSSAVALSNASLIPNAPLNCLCQIASVNDSHFMVYESICQLK